MDLVPGTTDLESLAQLFNLLLRVGVVSAKEAEPFSFDQPVDYPE
jgi:hypothetical protein